MKVKGINGLKIVRQELNGKKKQKEDGIYKKFQIIHYTCDKVFPVMTHYEFDLQILQGHKSCTHECIAISLLEFPCFSMEYCK